ncbi:DUF3244 domain-containing protein [Bacteroides sp.]|uniref:DUF3244 domain-containing protein n=1 Tax=Bacteroides sp. TaxID=29523 RepID=UPI002606C006|nr:DUF3244 domain-containing protein [Bacteroides sp.]
MKTKYLLLILGVFFCIGIKATEREIILNNCTNKENRAHDKRSISMVPTATIDGNTIRIYTDIAVEEIQVKVEDENGNVIYANSNMTYSKLHLFEISSLEQGEYTLEITIGDENYYGIFCK